MGKDDGEAMCKKIDIRKKNQFLDWAEEHLARIKSLTFAYTDNDHGSAKRHLREIKKTAVLSLLDTLARAFEEGVQDRRKEAFVRLIEGQGSWPDAKRFSAVHLVKALQVHFERKPCERALWDKLRLFLEEKHRWVDGENAGEIKLSFDPNEDEVRELWPCDEKGKKRSLRTYGHKPVKADDFKHSSLLYSYRNCLVHESREQTFSYENERDSEPVYITVGHVNGPCENHLVYPLSFLIDLTNRCILSTRSNVDRDPYHNFLFGPYIIQDLNEPVP